MRILWVEGCSRGWARLCGIRSPTTVAPVDWVQTLGYAEQSVQTTAYGDLILLDLMLPDGHGFGFLRKAQSHRKTTPVIILTARDQCLTRIEGLNASADDYLVKPF